MRHTLAASSLLLMFLLTGGAWISLTRFLPDGVSRTVAIVILGIAFVGVFLYQLVLQLRNLLGGPESVLKQLALVALYIALLLLAFAWMYQIVGIADNTSGSSTISHSFATSIYYSIVTFTTLGYGDYIPQGVARFLAALQALTGYIILGTLASSAASLISPAQQPSLTESEK